MINHEELGVRAVEAMLASLLAVATEHSSDRHQRSRLYGMLCEVVKNHLADYGPDEMDKELSQRLRRFGRLPDGAKRRIHIGVLIAVGRFCLEAGKSAVTGKLRQSCTSNLGPKQ